MDIASIVETILQTPDCIVHPPAGIPTVRNGHVLPDDLRRFFYLCGGVDLYTEMPFSLSIVPPPKLVLANPVIIHAWSEEELRRDEPMDISWSWYIIGEGANKQYITIDLSNERLGYCYDSYWELHAGHSLIIATSFTDLLYRLLTNWGQHWYWLEPGFKPLGSPYDLPEA